MSFLDKAKAAATDFAAKADQALGQAGLGGPAGGGGGDADRALRDLGVLAWLELNGRPGDAQARETVVATLRRLEAEGRLGSLTLSSAYATGGAYPPPPGAAAAQAAGVPVPPPPPGGAPTPPPPPGNSEAADRANDAVAPPPGPHDPYAGSPGPGPSVPPPPPPSWAKDS